MCVVFVCLYVYACVCVVRAPVRVCVHKVKIYHRSGTFNYVLCVCTKSRYTTGVVHSTVILVWQFDKHRLINI